MRYAAVRPRTVSKDLVRQEDNEDDLETVPLLADRGTISHEHGHEALQVHGVKCRQSESRKAASNGSMTCAALSCDGIAGIRTRWSMRLHGKTRLDHGLVGQDDEERRHEQPPHAFDALPKVEVIAVRLEEEEHVLHVGVVHGLLLLDALLLFFLRGCPAVNSYLKRLQNTLANEKVFYLSEFVFVCTKCTNYTDQLARLKFLTTF